MVTPALAETLWSSLLIKKMVYLINVVTLICLGSRNRFGEPGSNGAECESMEKRGLAVTNGVEGLTATNGVEGFTETNDMDFICFVAQLFGGTEH